MHEGEGYTPRSFMITLVLCMHEVKLECYLVVVFDLLLAVVEGN